MIFNPFSEIKYGCFRVGHLWRCQKHLLHSFRIQRVATELSLKITIKQWNFSSNLFGKFVQSSKERYSYLYISKSKHHDSLKRWYHKKDGIKDAYSLNKWKGEPEYQAMFRLNPWNLHNPSTDPIWNVNCTFQFIKSLKFHKSGSCTKPLILLSDSTVPIARNQISLSDFLVKPDIHDNEEEYSWRQSHYKSSFLSFQFALCGIPLQDR